MDRIEPIGPPAPDPQPVEPVTRRRDEDERHEPEQREGERREPPVPEPPPDPVEPDEDGPPHVDVRV